MAAADRARRAGSLACLWLAGCASVGYLPCPVRVPGPLPDDAFARCQAVLEAHFGGLAIADAQAFRLQTGWAPIDDPVGERRASVFRAAAPDELAVVVELRRLTSPWFAAPGWTAPRGDALAERELAELLQAALAR